jgi:hypothetical protein
MQINVSVTDANNIVCEVVPPQQQIIVIDRGVEGNGIVSIVPVTISTFQYLRITYTNGTVQDVGPLTSTAYTATSPITIVGNTISLATVPIASGGTDATTAAGAIQNLLPSYTGNANKRLGLNSGGTALEWVLDGGGTVTSVAASGGTTGLTFTGSPITTSGTLTLGGTLAVASGGTGVTSSTGTGSVVLSTSPTLVTPLLGTPTSGNFSTGTFTWPTFNQNTTGTASNVTGVVAIANGGTGQTTANAALNALLPTQTGNASKYLQTDGTNATWDAISLSTADITGILPTANGGTGLSSFTANGVVYASSTSALATGSALTFDGTNLSVDGSANTVAYKLKYNGSEIGFFQNYQNSEINFGSKVNAPILFYINNTEQMRLNSTGLGIKTSSVGLPLSIGASGTGFFGSGSVLNTYVNSNLGTTLDASGNLGIGTSSPSAKLDVLGNGIRAITSVGASAGSPLGGQIFLGDGNFGGAFALSGPGIGSVYNSFTSVASDLSFYYYNGARTQGMILNTAGNLGIGTSSPTSKLDVVATGTGVAEFDGPANATVVFRGSGFVEGKIQCGGELNFGSTNNYPVAFLTNGSERARIDTSGNLGIGTTSPAYKLDVNGRIRGSDVGLTSTSNWFYFDNFSGSNFMGLGGGTSLQTYVGGSLRTVIDSSGYFGLGTSSPTTLLSLASGTAQTLGLSMTPSGWNNARHRLTVPTSGDTSVWSFNYSGSAIDFSGYGTSAISVSSAVITFGTGDTNTAPSERMRIDHTGNVGIGTSSPAAKLEIVRTKSGTGAESFNLLRLNLSGTRAIGDSANITWYSGGNTIASINGISGADNIAYGTIAFSVRNYYTDSLVEALRIDNRSNLGLGVAPSAWLSTYRSMQIGLTSAITGLTNDTKLFLNNNAYFNASSQWVYAATSPATQYQLNDGQHRWYNAPSGTAGNVVTFTQAMTLDADGDLILGTTSTAAAEGYRFYKNYGRYDNGTFVGFIGGGTSLGSTAASDFVIRSENALSLGSGGFPDRIRITSTGDVGIGVTSPASKLDVLGDIRSYANGNNNGFIGSAGGTHIISLTRSSNNAKLAGYDGIVFFTNATTLSGGSEQARITSTGNFGLGTNSPNGKLTVLGNTVDIRNTSGSYGTGYAVEISTNANQPRVDWIDNSVYTGTIKSVSGVFVLQNNANNAITFGTNATERARIDSSGRVGVGVTNPVGTIDQQRGTQGIRLPSSAGSAVHFAGGYTDGGVAISATMLTVNLSTFTYGAITLHIFSTAYILNGGGPASAMIGTYDIVNILKESTGQVFNITRVAGPTATMSSSVTYTLSGTLTSSLFTLTAAVGASGQSGYTYTGYMVYGGQGTSSTNVILTTYDKASTSTWGA